MNLLKNTQQNADILRHTKWRELSQVGQTKLEKRNIVSVCVGVALPKQSEGLWDFSVETDVHALFQQANSVSSVGWMLIGLKAWNRKGIKKERIVYNGYILSVQSFLCRGKAKRPTTAQTQRRAVYRISEDFPCNFGHLKKELKTINGGSPQFVHNHLYTVHHE